jgi:hypothetical protein
LKAPQKSLKNWTDQKWRTKSGKPSTQGPKATGERYLPESAIKSLSSAEYAATSRAKHCSKNSGAGKAQDKRVSSLLNNQRALLEKQRGLDRDYFWHQRIYFWHL